MYTLKLDDETRRYIGDMLTGMNCTTMPISGLSATLGISRVTLTKWANDDAHLYWLTMHIDDQLLERQTGRRYYSHDSRFFDHAREYAQRILDYRRRAASGELGASAQKVESDRIRAQNSKR